MRLLFTLLFTVILIVGSIDTTLASGAVSKADSSEDSGSSVSISDQNVNDLISTLENKEARQEFISNLKTLKESIEEQDKSSGDPLEVVETLGIEETAEELLSSYELFLKENNLNSGVFEKSIVSGIAIIIALTLAYINRKVFVAIRRYMGKVRDKFHLSHDRFRLYARICRYIGYVIIFGLLIFSLLKIWDLSALLFMDSQNVIFAGSYIASILSVFVIGITLWEIANAIVEYGFKKMKISNSNRIDTLLPIIQNIMMITFIILFALILLSELGINIVPLMAGAGVLGIAIGFGAQTMVKDFLSGFTVILEDLIQVGDVAKVGDRIGLVERITIRKVQLRDLSGIVYTVPFGEVSIVENWTKDFSFYSMDIGVAYRENTDNVIELLREIDEELRNDDDFNEDILEPLEVMGVDAFADSAVIIKARIKTKPIKQWAVGREFNRRMKIKFDKHGVEIPFPHQTIYFGEDKEGKAPAAPIEIKYSEEMEESMQKDEKPKKHKSKKSDSDRINSPADNDSYDGDDGNDGDSEGK